METQLKNPNALPVGTVLASKNWKYTITDCIKSGGMAIAYAASAEISFGNITTEVNVAIKELFPSTVCRRCDNGWVIFSDEYMPQLKKDFRYEAEKLTRLKHPGIVKVNEWFEANNTLYYVMERIKGRSLTDYVTTHKNMSEMAVRKLLAPVFDAMKYIHSKKLLHLDLTPNNIMILENGEARVIDFGCSVHYSEQGHATKSVISGSYTPGYAPVEQVENNLIKFSPRPDVYALAGTFYYCLMGKHPKMVPDFSLIDNSPLRQVIAKAMAHEADKRTVSVEQFEAEIDAVLGIQESGTVLKPKDLPGRAVAGNFDVIFRVNDQGGKSWRRYVSLEEWEEIPSEERKNYTPEGVAVVVRAKSMDARPLRFGVVLADRKTKNGKRFFDKISAAQHAGDLPDGLELLAINGLRTDINNFLAAIGGTPIRHTYWVRENADSIVVAWMGDDSVPSSKPEAITAAIRPIIEID